MTAEDANRMNTDVGRDMHRSFFESGDGAILHWHRIARYADYRAALIAAIALTCAFLAATSTYLSAFREYCLTAVTIAGSPGALDENGATDYLNNEYLLGRIPRTGKTVILLGASYTHTSVDRDPTRAFAAKLEEYLKKRTGGEWRVMSFAEDGYTNWSNFYIARKIRLTDPPDVLIVGLDAFTRKPRDANLFLDSGGGLGDFSERELAPAVRANRLLLFECEARLNRLIGKAFPSIPMARAAAPGVGLRKMLKTAALLLSGKSYDALIAKQPRPALPESWRNEPDATEKVRQINESGGIVVSLSDDGKDDLEFLGKELVECQRAGTRVIVIALPKNPAVRYDFSEAHEYLTGWAERYGLEFHDLWTSGIVPDEYFHDSGHFFGKGAEIIAGEAAKYILEDDK